MDATRAKEVTRAEQLGAAAKELAETFNRVSARGVRIVDVDGVPYVLSITRMQTLHEMERAAIVEALRRNAGHRNRTAEELGMSVRTLYTKLSEHKIGNMDYA